MAKRDILNITNNVSGGTPRSASPSSGAVEQRTVDSVERVTIESTLTQSISNNVEPFGIYSNPIPNYPNDVVRLDIYNANNQYLESNYRVATYTKTSTTVTVSPEKDLANLGYISGKYKVVYRFHRNHLGSGDSHKLQIQEISADGLEIRVVPTVSTIYDNEGFLTSFAEKFFKLQKSQTLTNLNLFKDANTVMRVFDYVQDKFTFPTTPYSIIFKLTAPAPDGVVIGDTIWLSQQVSDDLIDTITIVPPKAKTRNTIIAGPNWDAFSKQQTAIATQYRDWDDLLSTNTQTSQDIVNSLLSSSFLEGIPLNIDYRSFENHIQFGSAQERLLNFKYKIQLLEAYDARITTLTTGLNGLPSSSVTSSVYFTSNLLDAKNKKAALLGSMDGYEKYLYFESSSYVTSSFGEFYPSTWPKSNSSKPYVNYSYSSSQAEEWFDGIISSASLYDQNNDKALYQLIPAHVLEDSANEGYVMLTQMIGHYFDLMYGYIKAMSQINNRDQSLLEGFSKDLVYHVAKNLGVDFENGTSLEELWSYTLGTDVTGSIASTYGITTQDKTKEVWKRIINNLPYLLKTKGTERGVRALINCFGIPQTILRIREYGGAEPDFDTKTDYVHERFFYATRIGQLPETGSVQYVSIPWDNLIQNSLKPMTIEVRAKMTSGSSGDRTLMGVKDQWEIKAFRSGSETHLGFFLKGSSVWATSSFSCPVYDGNWYHIALLRDNKTSIGSLNQTYRLVAKQTNYQKVTATYSTSLSISGATSASYNNSFLTGSGGVQRLVTADPVNFNPNISWPGSIQELRYWSETLDDNILDNHALAPTSFQGNTDGVFTGSTSSFYDLAVRFPLGADNQRQNYTTTGSIISKHPDQNKLTFISGTPTSGSVFLSPSIPTYTGSLSLLFEPVVEIHSLEWPDLGANRSISNKIRIDETFLAGENQLRRDNSVVRSSLDNYPPESSRLGIYLSPTNETNQDIAEQFGGISIDDYIGDPSHLSLQTYPTLKELENEYLKKYTSGRNRPQNYIRLLKHYDSALFQLIKKFVPYRANTQVGLVVEPHLLSRSKIPTQQPTLENEYYTSSIDLRPSIQYIIPGGFVQDGDGEPFRDGSGYVQEGIISQDYVVPEGDVQQIIEPTAGSGISIEYYPLLPEQNYDMVVVDGTEINGNPSFNGSFVNEFNGVGIDNNPSSLNKTDADLDLAISGYGRDTRAYGSQYIFTSYYQSGSQWLGYTSSRYDYHDPINPTLTDSGRSSISNEGASVYDIDIYGGKAFNNANPNGTQSSLYILTSSIGLDNNNWSTSFGFQPVSTYTGSTQLATYNTSSFWIITGSIGLIQSSVQGVYTSSARIPGFFYKSDDPSTYNLLYKVSVDVYRGVGSTAGTLELHFGDLDCGLTQSITLGTSKTSYTYTTSALGNWLGFRLYTTANTNTIPFNQSLIISSLRVECLNYRAQVQDYHLRNSYGMRTVRYDGSKMTSADWNINSPDTVDGGPVVEITVGGGRQLNVNPNVQGNYQIS